MATSATPSAVYVERHYARGAARTLPPTPLQRLRGWVAALRARLR